MTNRQVEYRTWRRAVDKFKKWFRSLPPEQSKKINEKMFYAKLNEIHQEHVEKFVTEKYKMVYKKWRLK